MGTYVELNNAKYPAIITGRLNDKDWDNRETKSIKMEMTYAEAVALFVDGCSWNIIQYHVIPHNEVNENGETTVVEKVETESYNNSEYCIAGPITDNRDGTVVVKMGKYTNEELLLMEVLA
jgi:hypothetical protein